MGRSGMHVDLPVPAIGLDIYPDTVQLLLRGFRCPRSQTSSSRVDSGVNDRESSLVELTSELQRYLRSLPETTRLEIHPSSGRCHPRLDLTQPSPSTIRTLLEFERKRPDLIPIRVDVSFDIVVETATDAEVLTRWVQERLVQLHLRGPIGTFYEETKYTRRRRWRTAGVAVYGDKKKRSGHVCHIEIRMLGANQCKRFEFRSLGDLLAIGPECWKRFFGRLFVFEEFDTSLSREHLGRLLRGHGNRKRPHVSHWGRNQRIVYNHDLRFAGLQLQKAASLERGDGVPSAQAIRAMLHRLGRPHLASRILRRLEDPLASLLHSSAP